MTNTLNTTPVFSNTKLLDLSNVQKLQEPKNNNLDGIDNTKENKKPKLDDVYKQWRAEQTPQNMRKMLSALQPNIDKALTSYAGSRANALRGRANVIAAKAVQSYKPDANASLGGWVSQSLRELQRYSAVSAAIKVPERVRIAASQLANTAQEFQAERGREPSIGELADITGMSQRKISKLLQYNKKVLTEGELINTNIDDDASNFIPGVKDDSAVSMWAEFVYHDLSDTDKKIYDMSSGREGEIKSVTEIAKVLNMSPSAVSQRIARISDRLEEILKTDKV